MYMCSCKNINLEPYALKTRIRNVIFSNEPIFAIINSIKDSCNIRNNRKHL